MLFSGHTRYLCTAVCVGSWSAGEVGVCVADHSRQRSGLCAAVPHRVDRCVVLLLSDCDGGSLRCDWAIEPISLLGGRVYGDSYCSFIVDSDLWVIDASRSHDGCGATALSLPRAHSFYGVAQWLTSCTCMGLFVQKHLSCSKFMGRVWNFGFFFWQIGYRRLGYLLFYEMMICDQEGRIEARSSLYPDALCNIVHKENVVCSLACPV